MNKFEKSPNLPSKDADAGNIPTNSKRESEQDKLITPNLPNEEKERVLDISEFLVEPREDYTDLIKPAIQESYEGIGESLGDVVPGNNFAQEILYGYFFTISMGAMSF